MRLVVTEALAEPRCRRRHLGLAEDVRVDRVDDGFAGVCGGQNDEVVGRGGRAGRGVLRVDDQVKPLFRLVEGHFGQVGELVLADAACERMGLCGEGRLGEAPGVEADAGGVLLGVACEAAGEDEGERDVACNGLVRLELDCSQLTGLREDPFLFELLRVTTPNGQISTASLATASSLLSEVNRVTTTSNQVVITVGRLLPRSDLSYALPRGGPEDHRPAIATELASLSH